MTGHAQPQLDSLNACLLPCVPEEFSMSYDSCLQDHSRLPIVPSGILPNLPAKESSSMLLATP